MDHGGFLIPAMNPQDISIHQYTYELPEKKIALFPSIERDQSRLLVYKSHEISEDTFDYISKYLPDASMLVFNNTRVINARLLFKKPGGSTIEIFCLEPAENAGDYNRNLKQPGKARWKCLIGNAAKWKDEKLEKTITINGIQVLLVAEKTRSQNTFIIDFHWKPAQYSFGEILALMGQTPLPPYIKRLPIDEDRDRYQTVYAQMEGSVAAPTAGLHFTNDTFKSLEENGISKAFVTLHVGAGTFKPVTSQTMAGHEMHHEFIQVDINTLRALCDEKNIIAVGTTSLRTLETLYWLGVKVLNDNAEMSLGQWEVYEPPLKEYVIPAKQALDALIGWMQQHRKDILYSQTRLLIAPGYSFRIAKALVTNFHQPQSTLLLLVAAAIGDDWKKLYDYALENNFRFLSYGDANLIFMDES